MSNYRIDPLTGEVVEITEQEKQERQQQKLIEEEANKKATNRFVRTVPGFGVDIVNSMVDLGRSLQGGLPSPMQDPQEYLKKVEERKPVLEKRMDRVDDATQYVYETLFGKDNIHRVQMGDRMIPTIKQPEGTTGQVVRTLGGIGASIYGAGKFKYVSDIPKELPKAKTWGQKFYRKHFRPSQRTKQNLIASEVGFFAGYNPYQESLLPKALGESISEDNEKFADLKAYLEADPNSLSGIENRIRHLADSVLLGGAFVVGGATYMASVKEAGKAATRLEKAGTNLGYNYTKEGIKKFQDNFITTLNGIRDLGTKSINNFLEQVQENTKMNVVQKELAIKNREKYFDKGKIKDKKGDIDALKPGFISRYFSDINPMFSDNTFLRGLESFRRKTLGTKGNKSLELQEKYLNTENLKEKWADNITNLATNLEYSMEEVVRLSKKFKNKKELNNKINYVLYTDFRSPTLITRGKISMGETQSRGFNKALKTLPEELREPVKQMRQLQTRLSQEMIDTGTLTKAQEKIYREQLEFYGRRSYKLYEDPNYIPSSDVRKEAFEFLSKQMKSNDPTLTDNQIYARVTAQINDILDVRKGTDFSTTQDKFDRVKKEILKGKKDIPAEIRQLLGEIDDPIQGFIHSTVKLSKYVEDLKFYDEAFESGAGIYFRENKEGVFKEVIPEGYGKLSGKYTTPELQKYFSNYRTWSEKALQADNIGGALYRNLAILKGLSQAAKTVWSHTTHVKNVTGGVQMSLANGINPLNPQQFAENIRILRARTSNDRALQELHEELSGLGLLNKGVVARDLKGLAEDVAKMGTKNMLDYPANFAKRLADADAIPYYSFKNRGFKTTSLSKHAEKWQNAYIAEDDFFKINMYFAEKKNLERINKLYKNKTSQLSEDEIKKQAAKIVRDVLPNYDLVPELLRALRRTPVAGRFFSFMAESVRISGNTVINGIKEVHKGKALIKQGETAVGNEFLKRGTLRLGAFTTMAGAGAKGAEKGFQFASGITNDILDALKDVALPDYMQNSNVIVTIGHNGEPVIANLSSWDAYDFPKKPFQVLINKYTTDDILNEDSLVSDVFSTTFQETVTPFLGESIVFETINDYFVRQGRTIDGRVMRNPNDKSQRFRTKDSYFASVRDKDNLTILAASLLKDITPGSVERGTDLYEDLTAPMEKTPYNQTVYENQAYIKFLTGWGMTPMNTEYLETVFGFKANNFKRAKTTAQSQIKNSIGNELDTEKFLNIYLKENSMYYNEYAKLYKNIQSAEKLGLNAVQLLDDNQLSRLDIANLYSLSSFNPTGLSKGVIEELYLNGNPSDVMDAILGVNYIDSKLSSIPIYTSSQNYKKDRIERDETIENLEEQIKRGQLKTGGKVLNVEEDPVDRTNPFTGNTYSQDSQMQRLGLFTGGKTSNVLVEGLKKMMAASVGTSLVTAPVAAEPNQQYKKYMGQYEYKPKIKFDEGGPVNSFSNTINNLLKNYTQQNEKQFTNGKHTHNAMVNKEPDKFVRDMYLELKESNHPFPELAAAQAGAESKYGMSDIAKKLNNTFGVKVRQNENFEGEMMPTKEDYGQGLVDEVANFRKYNSIKENVDGYVNFLNTGRNNDGSLRYKKALNANSSLEYLQELVNAGYATDQDYYDTVSAVYNRNLENGTYD
tara:strand:+ start:2269 stop:7203 length:4935 start_codon:yes stop_codon:yes gene_type:complete